jgi:hypothetical protein
MLVNRKILQLIVNDPASTEVERTEARRALSELTTDQSTPQSPRRGRNSHVAQTQEDKDSDVENWYRRDLLDSSLTCSDRRDIFQGFDESTQRLLDAFSNRLLGLFAAADPQVLIDAYRKTKSEFVKAKVIETIRHIAAYSPIDKTQAQQFIDQLDSNPGEIKLTNEQDQKIELTPEQTNPYLARPEDFQIGAPAQTSPTPGHGQRGDSKREEAQLLAKRKAQGKGLSLFVDRWSQHIPERYQDAVRSFGLFAPRSLGQTAAAIFVILGQEQKPRPKPRRWADSIQRDFGRDPLLDHKGTGMRWVGRLKPKASR